MKEPPRLAHSFFHTRFNLKLADWTGLFEIYYVQRSYQTDQDIDSTSKISNHLFRLTNWFNNTVIKTSAAKPKRNLKTVLFEKSSILSSLIEFKLFHLFCCCILKKKKEEEKNNNEIYKF